MPLYIYKVCAENPAQTFLFCAKIPSFVVKQC